MGVVISKKPCSVMDFRRAATTLHRRMMFFFTAGFRRSRYRYFRRWVSSASRLRLIWKGSSLCWQRPSTSTLAGTISMSPVAILSVLLSRSRTMPSTEMVDSLVMALKVFTMSSVSATTWVVP